MKILLKYCYIAVLLLHTISIIYTCTAYNTTGPQDGVLEFGIAGDVKLYRNALGDLQTDNNFTVIGNLVSLGTATIKGLKLLGDKDGFDVNVKYVGNGQTINLPLASGTLLLNNAPIEATTLNVYNMMRSKECIIQNMRLGVNGNLTVSYNEPSVMKSVNIPTFSELSAEFVLQQYGHNAGSATIQTTGFMQSGELRTTVLRLGTNGNVEVRYAETNNRQAAHIPPFSETNATFVIQKYPIDAGVATIQTAGLIKGNIVQATDFRLGVTGNLTVAYSDPSSPKTVNIPIFNEPTATFVIQSYPFDARNSTIQTAGLIKGATVQATTFVLGATGNLTLSYTEQGVKTINLPTFAEPVANLVIQRYPIDAGVSTIQTRGTVSTQWLEANYVKIGNLNVSYVDTNTSKTILFPTFNEKTGTVVIQKYGYDAGNKTITTDGVVHGELVDGNTVRATQLRLGVDGNLSVVYTPSSYLQTVRIPSFSFPDASFVIQNQSYNAGINSIYTNGFLYGGDTQVKNFRLMNLTINYANPSSPKAIMIPSFDEQTAQFVIQSYGYDAGNTTIRTVGTMVTNKLNVTTVNFGNTAISYADSAAIKTITIPAFDDTTTSFVLQRGPFNAAAYTIETTGDMKAARVIASAEVRAKTLNLGETGSILTVGYPEIVGDPKTVSIPPFDGNTATFVLQNQAIDAADKTITTTGTVRTGIAHSNTLRTTELKLGADARITVGYTQPDQAATAVIPPFTGTHTFAFQGWLRPVISPLVPKNQATYTLNWDESHFNVLNLEETFVETSTGLTVTVQCVEGCIFLVPQFSVSGEQSSLNVKCNGATQSTRLKIAGCTVICSGDAAFLVGQAV